MYSIASPFGNAVTTRAAMPDAQRSDEAKAWRRQENVLVSARQSPLAAAAVAGRESLPLSGQMPAQTAKTAASSPAEFEAPPGVGSAKGNR